MSNRRYTQFYSTQHNKPVQLDCNFVVDRTNANGLGISSLNGPGISAVYMNTSVAPAAGNPNPAAGLIVVKFQDNFPKLLTHEASFISPNSGVQLAVTPASLVVGQVYTIAVVGTTTAAQWLTLGLPVGFTPTVGMAFIAQSTGVGAGTGKVYASIPSGGMAVEVVGNSNLTLASNASLAAVLGAGSGAYMILQSVAPSAITQNGNTHSNTTIDTLTSTLGMRVGQAISGTGIPLGATIASITSSTAITISAAATATATVPVTVPAASVRQALSDGTIVELKFLFSNSLISVQGG